MAALREVLAELDVKVRGLGDVDAANAELDRYVASVTPALTEFEKLKIKQQEAAEMAARLAQRIRRLQKEEGDHAAKLLELRAAQVRATEAAREYARQADKLRTTTKTTTASAITPFETAWGKATIAMAGVTAVAYGIREAIRSVAEPLMEVIKIGDDLDTVSKRMGLTVGQLQELNFIARRTDVSAEALQKSFRTLARTAESGERGFREIGVSVKDSSGELRSQEEIFFDTVRGLGRMRNETRQAALAQRLFGRSGDELLTMVRAGPIEIDRLRQRFKELGGGLSDDVVENAAKADDALADLDLALLGLKGALAKDVIPAITDAVTALSDLTAELDEAIDSSFVGQVAFGVFAGIIVGLAFPFILLAAAIGVVVLAIDDVIVAFEGGDSVFGSFVESIYAAVGMSVTFQGHLERMEIGFTELRLAISRAFVELQEFLAAIENVTGLDIGAGAIARRARQGLTAQEQQLTNDRALHEAREAMRFAERNTFAFMRRGTAKGGAPQVNAPVSIRVDGASDPVATGNEIERRLRLAFRGALDSAPLAEPEAAT